MHLRAIAVVIALLLIGGCKKEKKAADNAGSSVASGSPSSNSGTVGENTGATAAGPSPDDDDYAKPILTDDKLQRYIKSLAEGKNPFAILGAVAGPDGSLAKADEAMKELEAVAKKYGFSGQDEYLDITGRILVGQTIIGTSEMTGSIRDSLAKSIAENEKVLADPSTPAETKTSVAETLKEEKQQLADMDKDKNGGLNEQDLALVKKYNAELEAAQKANAAMQKK